MRSFVDLKTLTYPKFCENKNSHMQSLVKIKILKKWRKGEIALLFTDIGNSCPSREFLTSQIYPLTLFEKIKFSRPFLIKILYPLLKTV